MSSSKTKSLVRVLSQYQPGAVAFSGGVDSTLLLYLAREAWSDPPLALTFISPLLTVAEKERVLKLADHLRVSVQWVKTTEYLDNQFKKNTPTRCYYCKRSRFRQARPLLNQKKIRFLLDGTNADDLQTYRPGIRASREAKVISPFALFNWTKKEIRRASRDLGLPTWDQPSSPCLATRVAYGQPLTLPLLKRLAQGEEVLFRMGFGESRLRVHSSLVRIEVSEADFGLVLDRRNRHRLMDNLTALGFHYITLDLKGYRSGSMDEIIKVRKRIILPQAGLKDHPV